MTTGSNPSGAGGRERRSVASRLLRILAGALAFLALVVAATYLLGPPLVRRQLSGRLSAILHRPVTVERVSINPFRLSAVVTGLTVKERDGAADAIRIDELTADLSSASLFRLAPVLDALTVTRPSVRVIRNPDRTYNYQDLIEEYILAPSEEPLPKFALYNISIRDGRIAFDDRVAGKQHEVTDLVVGVPFISNLPSKIEIVVQPALSGSVDGSPFGVTGETKPFKDTQQTLVEVDLDALSIPRYLDYSPVALPFQLPTGTLDTDLTLAFEANPTGGVARLLLSGTAEISDVTVEKEGEGRLLSFARLALDLEEADLLAPSVVLRSVRLERPEAKVLRRRDGSLNLRDLLPGQDDPAPAPSGASSGPPLALRAAEIAVTDGVLHLRDEVAATPAYAELRGVTLTVRDLDTAPGAAAHVEARFTTDAEGHLTHEGTLTLDPLRAEGTISVEGFRLHRLYPYYADLLEVEVKDGTIDLSTRYAAALEGDALAASVGDLSGTLRNLVLVEPGGDRPFWRMARLSVSGTSGDLATSRVEVGSAELAGVRVYARREPDGSMFFSRIMKEAPAAGGTTTAGETPWRIAIHRLRGSGVEVDFEDLVPQPSVTTRLDKATLDLEDLTNEVGAFTRARLSGSVNGSAKAAFDGKLSAAPLVAEGKVELVGLVLSPFQPYVAPASNVLLTGGTASAQGAVSAAIPDEGPMRLDYRGDLLLNGLTTQERTTSERLVELGSLAIGGIDATLEPMRVAVDEIAASDFYLRVVLDQDGTLNLWRALGGGAPPSEQGAIEAVDDAVADSAATIAGATAGETSPEILRFGRMTLQGGEVDITDYYVQPNYSARLVEITGAVTEMTPETPAELEVSARLAGGAPASIRGAVNVLSPSVFVDIVATARGIELSPFSPYMIKFAGYGIEKGLLSADLAYKVDQGALDAKNHLFVDQLTLGDRYDSPTATKLPVKTGIALLKDKNGVIDVDIPVTGSLDDPQFRVWPIVWKMIGNLVTKAVTSPFRFLAGKSGSDEELSYVTFEPGRAVLTDEARSVLDQIAPGFADRPSLTLEVTGCVAPEVDRDGLRKAALEEKVKAQQMTRLARKGEAPTALDAVTYAPEEYPELLEKAYREERFPKPKSSLGVTKSLPPEEMEALILANVPAGEAELRGLADRRAQAVKEYLATKPGVGPERVFIVAPKLTPEGIDGAGSAARAEFAIR